MDDEEVMLHPHDRATEVHDFPDTDIRDRQTLFDAQREDWLLQTEPLHGARPRQPGREHPPVVTGTAGLDGRGSDNTTERGSSDCRKSRFTTEGGHESTGGFTSSDTDNCVISGPTPEVPAVEKLLQRLLTETQSRPPLEWRGMFLLWKVGSCSNTMPELEWLISVYAARMAGREEACMGLLHPIRQAKLDQIFEDRSSSSKF